MIVLAGSRPIHARILEVRFLLGELTETFAPAPSRRPLNRPIGAVRQHSVSVSIRNRTSSLESGCAAVSDRFL